MRRWREVPCGSVEAGDKDDIVPAWHSCKMAAALQHATKNNVEKKIASLNVLKDAGHGRVILLSRRRKRVWRSGCGL
jgi:hypothetical protein